MRYYVINSAGQFYSDNINISYPFTTYVHSAAKAFDCIHEAQLYANFYDAEVIQL